MQFVGMLAISLVFLIAPKTSAATKELCIADYEEAGARLYPDSLAYYRKILPNSGKISFEKAELETLFRFRERSLLETSAGKTKIESAEEARLVGEILKTPVNIGDSFTAKDIDEKVLLRAFKGLALKAASDRKRTNPDADVDDLIQESLAALMQSIRKYRSTDTYMFSTTAHHPMNAAMDEVLRQSSSGAPLAPSDNAFRASRYFLRTGYQLKRKLKRNPTAREISAEWNRLHPSSPASPERVLIAIEQREYAARMTSETTVEGKTSDAIYESGGPSQVATVDTAMSDQPLVEAVVEARERQGVLAKIMMTGLDKRERLILGQYVGVNAEVADGIYRLRETDGATLDAVAAVHGVTRERIRQIVNQAERKIKRQILSHPEFAALFRDSTHYRHFMNQIDQTSDIDRPFVFFGH